MFVVILIIGIIEAAAFAALMYFPATKKIKAAGAGAGKLQQELASRKEIQARLTGIFDQLVDIGTLREKAHELKGFQEALKAERGRVTISQAELETVENRLRELEEIERELEASKAETKEEIRILQKKEDDLSKKNTTLKTQIEESSGKIDSLVSELEQHAQVQQEIEKVKLELLQCQEKMEILLVEIKSGNEQYFVLKQRYDALDIEYAQLYERFAEGESG